MEQVEIEKFKACLALAGIKEAVVPARIFYLVGRTLPLGMHAHDEQGPYLDCGPVRIRPLYSQESASFASQAEIEAFIQRSIVMKEV